MYSNLPYINEPPGLYSQASAEVPRSQGVTRTRIDEDRTRVYGGAKLKATQAYPPNFGRALAQIYTARRREIRNAAELQRCQHVREVKDLSESHRVFGSIEDVLLGSPLCEDMWHDAALEPVFDVLQSGALNNLLGSLA